MLSRHLGSPRLQRLVALLSGGVQVGRRPVAALAVAAADDVAGAARAPRCLAGLAQQQLHLAAQHLARARRQLERVVFALGAHVAERDQLAQHAAPLHLAQVGADAERAQSLVVKLRDLLGNLAAQHVDQVPGAELLPALLVKAVDARQRLARRLGGVPGGGRVQAVVAGVLVSRVARRGLFAEIGQQPHAPAVVRLRQCQQRVELAALAALEFLGRRAVVDHAALVHNVGQAVAHPGVGRQTVAPGAAGFLVVTLDVLRQIEVRDEAHVGLVDAHAERDGGHHHDPVLAQETVLVAPAHRGVEPGVVGQRRDAFRFEPGRGLVDLLARLAIDDAGLALVLVVDEAQQLGARVVFFDDRIAQVWPVEAADEDARVLQLQPRDDVGPRQVVGGGGQRNARHAFVPLVQHVQRQVVFAEIVAPLADAVRLVDREQAQQAALVE